MKELSRIATLFPLILHLLELLPITLIRPILTNKGLSLCRFQLINLLDELLHSNFRHEDLSNLRERLAVDEKSCGCRHSHIYFI
jgi:hypothetical protein